MIKEKDYVLRITEEALGLLEEDARFMLDGVRRDANTFDTVMDFVANYARALQQLNRDVVDNITVGTF